MARMPDAEGMSATTEQPGVVGFAKMAGSSIAGRDAAAWVTDFLNAAYYRRPVDERDVDDLRFAFGVLTTYWYRNNPSRRLRVTDLPAFHRAYGGERFGTEETGRGTLNREALERGAAQLIGDWFADGLRRRRAARVGHRVPNRRRARGLRPRAPHEAGQARRADGGERAAGGAGLAHLRPRSPSRPPKASSPPSRSPRRGPTTRPSSAVSRRCGPAGCAGQTFEIEVAANTRTRTAGLHPRLRHDHVAGDARRRAEVATRLVRGARGTGWRSTADARMRARGWRAAGRLRPHHAPGHFMGSGHNRLALYTLDGQA